MAGLFFRGIKRYFLNTLSLDRMGEEYLVFAVNWTFLMIYVTLESVFVNTLLYRVTPDIRVVIIYRGILFVAAAIAMQFAAYLSRKYTPIAVVRLGCILYLAMYLVLFFGMNHMHIMMYPAAILTGFGAALYWSGHNTLMTHYTNVANRDVGVSILCIIQGAAALSVPIMAGAVISFFYDIFGSIDTGYRVMFGAGMLAVILQVIYQRKLHPIAQPSKQGQLRLCLRLLRRKRSFQYLTCAELMRGFRDGAFGFILNAILFEMITSESLVGLNALLTGIAAIVGAWAYGRLVTQHSRVRYAVVATTMLFLFCLLTLFIQTAYVVMIFAVINSFFTLFLLNISNNMVIDVFTGDEAAKKCLAESLGLREICLVAGRVSGLLLFFVFPGSLTGQIYVMLILTAAQYLFALFTNLTTIALSRETAPMEDKA